MVSQSSSQTGAVLLFSLLMVRHSGCIAGKMAQQTGTRPQARLTCVDLCCLHGRRENSHLQVILCACRPRKGVFLHLRGSLLRLHTACLRVCLTLDTGEGPDWVCPDSPHSRGSLSIGPKSRPPVSHTSSSLNWQSAHSGCRCP